MVSHESLPLSLLYPRMILSLLNLAFEHLSSKLLKVQLLVLFHFFGPLLDLRILLFVVSSLIEMVYDHQKEE